MLARRFHHEGRRARALGSVVTGVACLAAFAGIASGSTSRAVILAFVAAVMIFCTKFFRGAKADELLDTSHVRTTDPKGSKR